MSPQDMSAENLEALKKGTPRGFPGSGISSSAGA